MYLSRMKTVTVKELKQNLAAYMDIAAQGESVLVTKYNRPYVRLVTQKDQQGLIIGSRVGKASLKPGPKHLHIPQWRRYLDEDRNG